MRVKNLLISSALVLSLGGCMVNGLPSGIAHNGCNPITGCQSKDYYLPGKGVWAEESPINKAKMMLVSLKAATTGTGACVNAQTTMA